MSTSPEATLRVLRDVLVERAVRNELVVIGRHAGVVGETVKIDLGASSCVVPLRVAESRPTVSEGTVRHRISLRPTIIHEDLETLVKGIPLEDPSAMLAVLASEIPVRVLNCSSSGCLLESLAGIPVGTVASLRLTLESLEFSDDLQVVRCRQIEGGSTYQIGSQFLWTAPPRHQSFRLGIGRQGIQAHPTQITPRQDCFLPPQRLYCLSSENSHYCKTGHSRQFP
jgi:hypothetical protein